MSNVYRYGLKEKSARKKSLHSVWLHEEDEEMGEEKALISTQTPASICFLKIRGKIYCLWCETNSSKRLNCKLSANGDGREEGTLASHDHIS
jgi:hypothetical protein